MKITKIQKAWLDSRGGRDSVEDEEKLLKKAGFTEATEEEISRATEVKGLIIKPKE